MEGLIDSVREAEESGEPVEHLHYWLAWNIRGHHSGRFAVWLKHWLDYRSRLQDANNGRIASSLDMGY